MTRKKKSEMAPPPNVKRTMSLLLLGLIAVLHFANCESVTVVDNEESAMSPDIESSMTSSVAVNTVSSASTSSTSKSTTSTEEEDYETVFVPTSDEKPTIQATKPPEITVINSMPVKLDMISSSKSETPKGTTAKSSSSTMSGSEMPRTATSAVTVTVTQYGSRSLPDSEYAEDDGKTEMTTSSATTTSSSDGNSDPRTASKEKEPKVGSVNSRRAEQSELPPTPTSEESESNSPVVSTEKSPVETTSNSLESSMTSSVQVTYSFGQLGTASLFNDIVPDPSDKPHLTSLTMTIDPSDVRTFAPVSSSSDAGHFLGLRAPQIDNRSTVGPAKSQDGSENEEHEHEDMAKGPFRDEPRGGGAAASNLEFGPRASAELPSFTKKSSRADSLPDMSDILTGLFNVVGEGLSIATNYVKEQSKNKEIDVVDQDGGKSGGDRGDIGAEDKVDRLPPASLTSRVNNRGPPRFTEIPFEAIPLEVLQSKIPGGGGKVQIQQRPFHTKRIKVTKTRVRPPPTQPTRLPPRPPSPPRPPPPRQQPQQRPPYVAGIPLPELLIPEDLVLPPKDGDENGIGKNGNVNNAFGFNFVQQGELNYNEAGLRPRPPRPPPLRKRPQIPERKPVLFPAEIPGNGNIPGKRKPFPGKDQVNGDVNKNNNNDNDDFDLLVHTYFPDVESRPLPEIQSSIDSTSTTTAATTATPTSGTSPPKRRRPSPTSSKQPPRRRRPTPFPPIVFKTRKTTTTESPTPLPSTSKTPIAPTTAREKLRPGTVVDSPDAESPRWPAAAPKPAPPPPPLRFPPSAPPPRQPQPPPPRQPQPPPPPPPEPRPTAAVITSPPYGGFGGRGGGVGAGGGDVFDVTVTAQQNFNGKRRNQLQTAAPPGNIITQGLPGQEFVYIDTQKTYFDIGPPGAGGEIRPTRPPPPPPEPSRASTNDIRGSALPVQPVDLDQHNHPQQPQQQPMVNPRPPQQPQGNKEKTGPTKRPKAPPVRIDTCIVGEDSTCEKEKHEVCKTKLGVSSCFCKPGYGRRKHRQKCHKTIRLLMSMQVDRLKQQRIFWSGNYLNPNSHEYQTLEDESNYAIDSAMALTSLNSVYLSNSINRFFPMNGKVTVNCTLEMVANPYTRSTVVKRDIQRKLIQVIQARSSNIGNGNLYVDGPLNPIPGVADLNECAEPEMHDCHELARCVNLFGGYACQCREGYGDRYADDEGRSGRFCESCSKDFCHGRGECKIEFNGGNRQFSGSEVKVCDCKGNFYGRQCQIDGEVVIVAIGASVAAVFIIVLTLICLCMWSRRWKREQQKADLLHPAYRQQAAAVAAAAAAASYMNAQGPPGHPPPNSYLTSKSAGLATANSVGSGAAGSGGSQYNGGPTLEDRVRWAQMAEQRVNTAASITQNIYAQPSVTEGSVVPGMGRLGRYQSQLLLHNDSESEPDLEQQQSHHQHGHRQHAHQRWANRARNRASYSEQQHQQQQHSYLPPFYASGNVSDISAHSVVNGNHIPLATYHRNKRNTRKS